VHLSFEARELGRGIAVTADKERSRPEHHDGAEPSEHGALGWGADPCDYIKAITTSAAAKHAAKMMQNGMPTSVSVRAASARRMASRPFMICGQLSDWR
jgi:hypothetical protein